MGPCAFIESPRQPVFKFLLNHYKMLKKTTELMRIYKITFDNRIGIKIGQMACLRAKGSASLPCKLLMSLMDSNQINCVMSLFYPLIFAWQHSNTVFCHFEHFRLVYQAFLPIHRTDPQFDNFFTLPNWFVQVGFIIFTYNIYSKTSFFIKHFGFQVNSSNLITRIKESTDRSMDKTHHPRMIYHESLCPYTCTIPSMMT